MIIGGAGGVGSGAVQPGKWAGLHLTATASRAESGAWVWNLGADDVTSHARPMAAQLRDLGQDDVSNVLCTNGTEDHWLDIVERLRLQEPTATIDMTIDTAKAKSLSFA